jgi:hypothetical protein
MEGDIHCFVEFILIMISSAKDSKSFRWFTAREKLIGEEGVYEISVQDTREVL